MLFWHICIPGLQLGAGKQTGGQQAGLTPLPDILWYFLHFKFKYEKNNLQMVLPTQIGSIYNHVQAYEILIFRLTYAYFK